MVASVRLAFVCSLKKAKQERPQAVLAKWSPDLKQPALNVSLISVSSGNLTRYWWVNKIRHSARRSKEVICGLRSAMLMVREIRSMNR
jgi:hypothetical protein